MIQIIKRLSIFLISVIVAMACYETWRVLEARAITPELIERLASTQMYQLKPAHGEILIKVEDPTFLTNNGIDFDTPGQGLTTLTQALAKQLYFERFTPGLQKLELILISRFALTPLATKDDVLHAFVAVAYLGQDDAGSIVGFPEAARRWFGKSFHELSDDEFISLVAMLIAPNSFNPRQHPQENKERVTRIKRLIAGACAPIGLLDVALEGCRRP
jgi:membrane peptidoglycan carboxypeptidase